MPITSPARTIEGESAKVVFHDLGRLGVKALGLVGT
jgi:hypothetical protein